MQNQQLPERQLKRAFMNRLYRQYGNELYLHMEAEYGEGPPAPEEITQTAFERISLIDRPHKIESERAFLYQLAKNLYRFEQSKIQQAKLLTSTDHKNTLSQEQKKDLLSDAITQISDRQIALLKQFLLSQTSLSDLSKLTKQNELKLQKQLASALTVCTAALSPSSNNQKTINKQDTLQQEAAVWYLQIGSGELDTDKHDGFQQWLFINPTHEQAFKKIQEVSELISPLLRRNHSSDFDNFITDKGNENDNFEANIEDSFIGISGKTLTLLVVVAAGLLATAIVLAF